MRSRRPPVLVLLAGVIAAVIAVLVVAGTWITPYDPSHQDLMNAAAGPGGGHPLGTDNLGRDVLSLLIAGARTAVLGPCWSRWSPPPWARRSACWPAGTAASRTRC